VRSAGKTTFVNMEDVRWIQGAENYVQLHTATSHHFAHATIQSLLGLLDPGVFVRIHRSNIVNVRHISQIETGTHGDYVLTLNNGERVHSSRTYREVIKKLVSNRL
jgi:two-component system LytT family response regulator